MADAMIEADNFGRWQSDFQTLLRHCLNEDVCGKPIATLLQPRPRTILCSSPSILAFMRPRWRFYYRRWAPAGIQRTSGSAVRQGRLSS